MFEVGAASSDNILKIVESIVQYGLVDTAEEVMVLCLQILAKVAEGACAHMMTKIDQIMPIFEKKLTQNFKLVAS